MQSRPSLIFRLRQSLTHIDALPQLTAIGVVIGFVVGLLIIGFRLVIEYCLNYLVGHNTENFEQLPALWHFLLPFIGSIIIAAGFYFIPKKFHGVGIGHVLERLHNYQGRLFLGNFIVQFIAGALSLISGQSVGREGPAVHLGANAASLLGQWLKLPNNSLRTLIGCGVAAAIASSFNTPIAGVIFAMEVVLMSYSIVGFIPIMMASVCGAIMTQLVFGEETLFSVSSFQMSGLWEMSLMPVAGFIIGILATLYMRLQLGFNRLSHYSITTRLILAGFVTGCLALIAPEILGLGYDTVNLALQGKIAVGTLCIILVAKVLATSFSISMGIPGGLIGPQLFIGACVGGMIGYTVELCFPETASHSGFYVLLGMTAMMGAVINAPLAALTAVLELTYNPGIIFPSMLVIVIACITTRQLFKCEGIFIEQLLSTGKRLNACPAQQILSGISVHRAMKTAFISCPTSLSLAAAKIALADNPLWIIINNDEKILLRAADLASFIDQDTPLTDNMIELLEIPGQRFNLCPINERATLYEAQQLLVEKQVEALYVLEDTQHSDTPNILGIVTHNTINNHYQL